MLALAPIGAPAATVADRCFHCAAPLPAGSRWTAGVDGTPRAFCCAGCMTVAATLCDAGLASLYAARKAAPMAEAGSAAWEALADPARAPGLVSEPAPGRREMSLIVEGMSCGACAGLIEGSRVEVRGSGRVNGHFLYDPADRVFDLHEQEQVLESTLTLMSPDQRTVGIPSRQVLSARSERLF